MRFPMCDRLGNRKAMENQSPSTEQIGDWIKFSKVWIFFIVPEISLFAFKYRPGENPLYEADHVGVYWLLGSSLIVYITTLVVLSLMKTPKPPRNRLPLLILLHVCWSCGALACAILSSLLFMYGWVMFCFYALFLWAAPCEPVMNLSRLLRHRPSNDQHHHLDSIDLTVVVELPVPQAAAYTLDIQQECSNSSSSEEDLESPQVWKYI